ncbi:hypothetical protein D3C76_1859960 [compost metagenome]
MRDRRRDLAEHRQLVILISRLFDPFEIGNVFDAKQEIPVHLIPVSDRDEPVPAVFID